MWYFYTQNRRCEDRHLADARRATTMANATRACSRSRGLERSNPHDALRTLRGRANYKNIKKSDTSASENHRLSAKSRLIARSEKRKIGRSDERSRNASVKKEWHRIQSTNDKCLCSGGNAGDNNQFAAITDNYYTATADCMHYHLANAFARSTWASSTWDASLVNWLH